MIILKRNQGIISTAEKSIKESLYIDLSIKR